MSDLVSCSICAETKVAVELCACNNQPDKRVCESCAVQMHGTCENPSCSCFGFRCAFCRQSNKKQKQWTETSALYWKSRCQALDEKVKVCADIIEDEQENVQRLLLQLRLLE